MGIARQIFILLALVLVITIGLTVILLESSARITREDQKLIQDLQIKYEKIFSLIEQTSQTQVAVQKIIRERDIDQIEKLVKQVETLSTKALQAISEANAQGSGIEDAFKKLSEIDNKVVGTVLQGNFAAAMQLYIEEADPAYEKLFHSIEIHKQKIKESLSAQVNINKKASNSSRILSITIAVIGLTLLLGFGWAFRKKIMSNLTMIAAELRQSCEYIRDNISTLTSASSDLNTKNSEQAAAVEETSASMEEMTSMTNRNADNAEKAKELANSSRTSVQKGAEQVHLINDAVSHIQLSASELQGAMSEIQASSQAISKVLKNINEIAFQTNLLALNAAVEAARAGEAGMGFAVVADEVRNLAKRCADSSMETNRLLEDSISKSRHGVASSQKVSDDLQTIIQQVASFEQVLKDIDEQSKHLNQAVAEIAQACQEQNIGASQINMSISHIDKATQSNAAQSQEVALAAENFGQQAGLLNNTVEQLNQMIGARNGFHGAQTPLLQKPSTKMPTPRRLIVPAKSKTTAANLLK